MLGGEQHGSASVGSHEPNLFRGMIFGMTTRYACTDISTPIWKLWDSFKIDQAEMVGWWDDDTPVTVAEPDRGDVRVCAEERDRSAAVVEQACHFSR